MISEDLIGKSTHIHVYLFLYPSIELKKHSVSGRIEMYFCALSVNIPQVLSKLSHLSSELESILEIN